MNKTAANHIKTFHLYNFFPRKRKSLTAPYFLTLCQELLTLGKYCQKKHVEVKVHCPTKGVWYNSCPLIWSSAMTVIIQCRLHCLDNPDPNRAFPELRRHEIPHVFFYSVCSVNAKVPIITNTSLLGISRYPYGIPWLSVQRHSQSRVIFINWFSTDDFLTYSGESL
jgi:hypothetical protein